MTLRLDDAGAPPAEIAIDAAPASDAEARLLACVRDRLAATPLHPVTPPPVRVSFGVVLDPYRGPPSP